MRKERDVIADLGEKRNEFYRWNSPELRNDPIATSLRFTLHQEIARLEAELTQIIRKRED